MNRDAPQEWLPDEKPLLPGSPSLPNHPLPRRIAYLLVGILVTLTGGLGNALVTVNLITLQGSLGAYATEAAWLPAAYLMTNASINLLLVKFRQQFGLSLFTGGFLALYALVTFAHLFVGGLNSAIAVRAAHGAVAAALSSLGLYYVLQGFKKEWRLKGVVVAFGASQLALPVAYVFSTDLLQLAQWRGLTAFELGLAVLSLGCVLILPLPPGDRTKAFEKMDFLTFALFAPGMALLCAVLSLGRIVWWTEEPWIGVALAASIVLIAAALYIEHHRVNPLLNARWVTSAEIVRFGLSMTLVRIVLSEQGTSAVGFLRAVGLDNDQMTTLFTVVLFGVVAGIVACALTLSLKHLTAPVVAGLLLIAAGAFVDAHATSQTRPQEMYASQFLLAFGGSLFLGPVAVRGIGGVIAQPRNIVSFIVLFGLSQNLGGAAGAAALGTFQTVREKFHSSLLVEHLTLLDPQVASRVQGAAAAYGGLLADPAARGSQGVAALGAAATREANVLAYNDTFLLIALVAFISAAWIFSHALWQRRHPAAPAPAPAAAPSPSK
jgi:hypothetical protein